MRWLVLAWLGVAPHTAWAGWDRYELIIWQDQTPERLAALKDAGFTAAKLNGNGGVDPAALAKHRASGLQFYIENIATDYYAPYHRYTPGRNVTWLWDAQKSLLQADPARQDVFVRAPGLLDPAWQERVARRLTAVAAAHEPGPPLFYTLADETGIGDLAAAWDADTAPESLAAFRDWLASEYSSLAALNQQWGTAYASWSTVAPELTDAALARTDGNYSAWSDFKAFMDVSFTGALRMGTDAVHRGDPAALAALEGAQVPGWGGYDYARLAPTVDVMEIYDSGLALELARAFNPALIPLRTSFENSAAERHAAWSAFLHGVRGTIVWDDDGSIVGTDGQLSARARALAAQTREFQALAPLVWATVPHRDAVAIVVSQASFRVGWLLDRHREGGHWWERDAEREGGPNAWRTAREQMAGHLFGQGLNPVWLATADSIPATAEIVVLPHTLALSDQEITSLRAFEARGGVVVAGTEAGLYDGHGRRRAVPPAFTTTVLSGPAAAVRVTDAQGLATGLVVQVLDGADGQLVAIQSARPDQVSRALVVNMPRPAEVTDVRTGEVFGRTQTVAITLDAIDPTILRLRRALPP